MRETLAVDRGIPVPKKGTGPSKYPWRKMKVGDSFLVPSTEIDMRQTWNSLSSCATYASYKTGFKFTIRTVIGGLRIWRIL